MYSAPQLTGSPVIPSALRGARFIPHAGAGKRAYAMLTHPETGEDVSAYKLGKPQGWWEWSPGIDAEIRASGGTLASPPDAAPLFYAVDCDTPLDYDGRPIVDGFRVLMDRCVQAGEIPDTTGWLMVKTPGHARAGGPAKANGRHIWFRAPEGFRPKTGAIPCAHLTDDGKACAACRSVELKAMCTAPGSPGYAVTSEPDGAVPELPRWICDLLGEWTPREQVTETVGWSVSEDLVRWAKWACADAKRRREHPVPLFDGIARNISALTGDERLKAFDRVQRLESDEHPLHTDWFRDEELQGKYLHEFLPRLRLGTVRADDEWIARRFTREELERLAGKHKRIRQLNGEIVALDIIQPKETDWRSEDGGDHSVTDQAQRWLAVLVPLYLAELKGWGLSAPQVAAVINRNKELCGLIRGWHRDVSSKRVQQLKQELRRAGLLTEDIPGHSYLYGHAFAHMPGTLYLSDTARGMVLDHLSAIFSALEPTACPTGKNLADWLEQQADGLLKRMVKARHKRYWKIVRQGRRLAAAWRSEREGQAGRTAVTV